MALAIPPGGGPPPTDAWSATLAPCPLPDGPVADAPRRCPAPAVPLLSVVIVNFCQWRNTARLVDQLRRCEAVRTGRAVIVVVDNHSPFHPVVRQLESLSGVVLRRFDRNLGFARAVNRGANLTAARPGRAPGGSAAAVGEWVLLLNPDVTVADGFLDQVLAAACRFAVEQPRLGVVGFRMRNRDGSPQASSGPFPTLWRTLWGLSRPRSRRKCTHRPEPYPCPVDWVTGGCLLVRRQCLQRLGGLDEAFFLYYEDVDFCRRAALAGWTVWFDPTVEVTHHWPLHARRVPPALRLITRHALLTYAEKYWSPWARRLLRVMVWAEAVVRQAWAVVRGDWEAIRCYGQLRRLVGDLTAGRPRDVRRRLRYAAAYLYPVAAEQDGRTR